MFVETTVLHSVTQSLTEIVDVTCQRLTAALIMAEQKLITICSRLAFRLSHTT